jgi:ElaB/YqjD/DUF883 family membrane-anchored ribosome-binding protein
VSEQQQADSDRAAAGGDNQGSAAVDPLVRAAEEKVRLAREELRKAESYCDEVRRKASQQVDRLREMTIGEMIDGTLNLVKKHPGPGVILAAAAGFFLGRLFRRLW